MSTLALVFLGLGLVLPKKTADLSTGISMKYVETGDPSGEAVFCFTGLQIAAGRSIRRCSTWSR